jgi:hypothetical protein
VIERANQPQLQQLLDVEPDTDGAPRWSGVTSLLRQALARWGLSRPATVVRHVRHTLDACGFGGHDERIRDALDLLCVLGDAELVWADGPPVRPIEDEAEREADAEVGAAPAVMVTGRLVAPTLARAVRLGQRTLVLGSREVDGVCYQRWGSSDAPCSAARWLDITAMDALEASGFELVAPERWFGPSSVLDHLERREAEERSLKGLWPALQRSLDVAGGPVADASDVRLLGGEPGAFWGRAASGNGRWRTVNHAPSGDVLGVLLGRFGKREQPIIARVERGAVQRVLELYDHEELRWAALSRGVSTGAPERLRVRDGALHFTCPVPTEARRPRAICAVDAWAWTPPPFVDVAELGEAVAARFGLLLD